MRLLPGWPVLVFDTLLSAELGLRSERNDCNKSTAIPDLVRVGVRFSIYILLRFVCVFTGGYIS